MRGAAARLCRRRHAIAVAHGSSRFVAVSSAARSARSTSAAFLVASVFSPLTTFARTPTVGSPRRVRSVGRRRSAHVSVCVGVSRSTSTGSTTARAPPTVRRATAAELASSECRASSVRRLVPHAGGVGGRPSSAPAASSCGDACAGEAGQLRPEVGRLDEGDVDVVAPADGDELPGGRGGRVEPRRPLGLPRPPGVEVGRGHGLVEPERQGVGERRRHHPLPGVAGRGRVADEAAQHVALLLGGLPLRRRGPGGDEAAHERHEPRLDRRVAACRLPPAERGRRQQPVGLVLDPQRGQRALRHEVRGGPEAELVRLG